MTISPFLVLTEYEIVSEQTTLGPTVIPDDNFLRHENLNSEHPGR